jgi:hypothetical protein
MYRTLCVVGCDGYRVGNKNDGSSHEDGVVGIQAGQVGPFVSTTSHIISIVVHIAKGK